MTAFTPRLWQAALDQIQWPLHRPPRTRAGSSNSDRKEAKNVVSGVELLGYKRIMGAGVHEVYRSARSDLWRRLAAFGIPPAMFTFQRSYLYIWGLDAD